MSEPKAHARFAASSCERWVNCPGSLKLIEKAPPQGSSSYADEGTLAHEIMETVLLGHKFTGDAPLEMIEHVDSMVEFVKSQMTPHTELIVEEKVFLDFIHPTDCFGTVDVALVEPFGTLHVIDFKYGKGFVNHKDNMQMLFYALGIAHKHFFDFDKIKTTIFQPRLEGADAARTYEFSPERLKRFADELKEAVKRAEVATTNDVVAGSWCKFCPAKVICPAISKNALQKAQLDFAAPVLPEPKHLSVDQLKTVLDQSEYLELWVTEVKKYAEEMIKSGEVTIPGWGLVPKRAQRVFVNIEDKHSIGGIELKKEVLKSVAEVERELKKVYKKEHVSEILKAHTVSVSSGDRLGKTKTNYDENWGENNFVD